MAENSKDYDSLTYGSNYKIERSDFDDRQENTRGSIHRIQGTYIGSGSVSVPNPVLDSPVSLNGFVGAGTFIDPNGKAFGWDVSQTFDVSQASHGASIGSTAPATPSTLRYIVISANHVTVETDGRVDAEGAAYNHEQNSSFEKRVYQTTDIASPDDIEANVTLKALINTVIAAGSLPIAVYKREFGVASVDDVWNICSRAFQEGDPIVTRLTDRSMLAYGSMPAIADDDAAVAAAGGIVGGTGGEVIFTGGEIIHIGWIDNANTLNGAPAVHKVAVVMPVITVPVAATTASFTIRMHLDKNRVPVITTGLGDFPNDADLGLLQHGTDGDANHGFRSTLIDIPLCQVETGAPGSTPTVTVLVNSVRSVSGELTPFTPTAAWADAAGLFPSTLNVSAGMNAIVTDLAAITGDDKVGSDISSLWPSAASGTVQAVDNVSDALNFLIDDVADEGNGNSSGGARVGKTTTSLWENGAAITGSNVHQLVDEIIDSLAANSGSVTGATRLGVDGNESAGPDLGLVGTGSIQEALETLDSFKGSISNLPSPQTWGTQLQIFEDVNISDALNVIGLADFSALVTIDGGMNVETGTLDVQTTLDVTGIALVREEFRQQDDTRNALVKDAATAPLHWRQLGGQINHNDTSQKTLGDVITNTELSENSAFVIEGTFLTWIDNTADSCRYLKFRLIGTVVSGSPHVYTFDEVFSDSFSQTGAGAHALTTAFVDDGSGNLEFRITSDTGSLLLNYMLTFKRMILARDQ